MSAQYANCLRAFPLFRCLRFLAVELKTLRRARDERSRKFFADWQTCEFCSTRATGFAGFAAMPAKKTIWKLCGSSWPDTIIRCVPCSSFYKPKRTKRSGYFVSRIELRFIVYLTILEFNGIKRTEYPRTSSYIKITLVNRHETGL